MSRAFEENADLRKGSPHEKIEFAKRERVDFIDLILEVKVEKGFECDRRDSYLDDRISLLRPSEPAWDGAIDAIHPDWTSRHTRSSGVRLRAPRY
jgi:hypothetical protein